MKRQFGGQEWCQRGDPGEDPWKRSFVMVLQMIWKKTRPVKSATQYMTLDLPTWRDVRPRETDDGGLRG